MVLPRAAMSQIAAAPVLPRPRAGSGIQHAQSVQAVIDGTIAPRLVLQPIVDIRAGRVVGYEALARFGRRLRTPPGPWFDAAARLRQSAELEAMLIEQALQLRPSLPPGRHLAVNVNPTLLATRAVSEAFSAVDDLTGVVVELTEGMEFEARTVLEPRLKRLRARGALLALDDVGAGWGGLRQVAELRPDIVKLDRTVVADADRDEVKLAVVEMMLRLCTRLGSQLLCEGVETQDELDLFARLGVPLAQGWIFGQPAVKPPQIDEDLAVRLKFMAGLARHIDKVASLIDVAAPTVSADVGPAEPGPRMGDVLVALDAERCPVLLVVRDRGGVHRLPVMSVLASDATIETLGRAMTRPVEERFDPLVCVDRAGRYVGILRLDALARGAARRDETTTVPTG